MKGLDSSLPVKEGAEIGFKPAALLSETQAFQGLLPWSVTETLKKRSGIYFETLSSRPRSQEAQKKSREADSAPGGPPLLLGARPGGRRCALAIWSFSFQGLSEAPQPEAGAPPRASLMSYLGGKNDAKRPSLEQPPGTPSA